jgi:hypothetical protein
MKIVDMAKAITVKCEKCSNEVTTNPGIANLMCITAGCKGKKVSFNVDVLRRPVETEIWQNCDAGKVFESSYSKGTVNSGIYEIKRDETVQEEVKEVPDSVKQFETKEVKEEVEVEVKKEEVKEEPKKIHRLLKTRKAKKED